MIGFVHFHVAELAINNSVNDSTGLSPAHIIYG